MIESLPDELNQFESEYAKGAKLYANIILELERDKCCKTYVNVLERKLYTDDKKTKYSSNPNNILKTFMKNSIPGENLQNCYF